MAAQAPGIKQITLKDPSCLHAFMRIAVLALALIMLLPAASARELPVWRDVDVTLPDGGCPDCVIVGVGAGWYIPNCYDCPTVGVRAEAGYGGGAVVASARACYSSYYGFCIDTGDILG